MRFIHTDDDILFVSQDNSDEWFDVPRPITSMPAPKKVVKEMMQQRCAAERETEKIGAKGNEKRDVTLWW